MRCARTGHLTFDLRDASGVGGDAVPIYGAALVPFEAARAVILAKLEEAKVEIESSLVAG